MEYESTDNSDATIIRLDKGDPVIKSLQTVAEDQGVQSGEVTGIGAVMDPVLGYYQLEDKAYKKDTFSGAYELTNLTGVITKNDGVDVHAHATIADDDHRVYGGHFHAGRIAAAGEFFLYDQPVEVSRRHQSSLGLGLMDFGN
jgi:predicted DNA-binding protein with PD1-like motif